MSEMNSQALKAKIKNLIGGNDSTKAQVFLRNYFMERFLARLSQSEYKENFVLKGGMLVSALIGIQQRYTMDMDTTLRSKPLTEKDVRNMVNVSWLLSPSMLEIPDVSSERSRSVLQQMRRTR